MVPAAARYAQYARTLTLALGFTVAMFLLSGGMYTFLRGSWIARIGDGPNDLVMFYPSNRHALFAETVLNAVLYGATSMCLLGLVLWYPVADRRYFDAMRRRFGAEYERYWADVGIADSVCAPAQFKWSTDDDMLRRLFKPLLWLALIVLLLGIHSLVFSMKSHYPINILNPFSLLYWAPLFRGAS